MTLDQFPRGELVKIISEKFIRRKELFSQTEITLFIHDLDRDLFLESPDKAKFQYLKSKLDRIKNDLLEFDLDANIDLSSFGLIVNKRVSDALNSMDLARMEFSNQANIHVMQDIIDRSYFYIDEINLLSKGLANTNPNKWEELIDNLIPKSKANHEFLHDLNKRFNYDLIDEADNQNVDSFSLSLPGFYEEMAADLLKIIEDGGKEYEVLHLYVEGEPIPDEEEPTEVIPPKSPMAILTVIQQYSKNRSSEFHTWIEEISEIKKKYDENDEDVNFDRLLREVMYGTSKITDNEEYLLILKRDLIVQKLKNLALGNDDSETYIEYHPETENLAIINSDITELRYKLDNCYNILKGNFIKECHPIIFRSLFETGKFIAPVDWIGANYELKYFITELKDEFHEKQCWPNVHNCFTHNGKPFGTDSIRSPGTKDLPKGGALIVLDKAIAAIIG